MGFAEKRRINSAKISETHPRTSARNPAYLCRMNRRSPIKPDLVLDVREPAELMPFLLAQLPHKNRNNVKTLLRDRQVWVDGRAVSQFNHPLRPGQQVTIEQLLQGTIVLSANDAAIALAEAVATTEAAFVERMNARAQRMGLRGTRFVNCTGEPVSGHQSTARDLAALALALQRDFPQHHAFYSQRELAWNGLKQANRNLLV